MKILYVSTMPLQYSSSANMRNIALLKGLQENNNELYLLTQEPQQNTEHYDNTLNSIKFKKEYLLKLGNIHSKVTMKKNKKNILKNFIYNFLMKFKIYDFKSSLVNQLENINIDEKFDLIISSSDPKSSHLLAKELLELNPGISKKWIQYWGDPFAKDINNKKIIPEFMIKTEEKRLISKADIVIYVSPFTLEMQQKIYPEYKEKMKFFPIPYLEEILYEKTKNENLVLGYFGDYFIGNRNINPLYNAVKKQYDKKLIICGNTDLKLEETSNIKIYKRQSIQEVRKLEKEVDILVCVCNSQGTQIPGKIYHYAATNKPILIIVDGENSSKIKSYLEEYDRFIICENNIESICKIINNSQITSKEFMPVKRINAKMIASEIIKTCNYGE